jgi:alpha-glucosidase (family GH31 glycosyl hydrolase)
MGIFFRNSNAQSPVLAFNDDGGSTLSYITTGGNLEIFFFFKGTAKEVIANYQSMIGFPSLPPFWALGWHASSGDYKNMTALQENIQGYADAGVPLEGVWLTNAYMNDYSDFSVNGTAFPDLAAYTQELRAQDKRMIVVVDAGLSADDTDNTYF